MEKKIGDRPSSGKCLSLLSQRNKQQQRIFVRNKEVIPHQSL